MTVAFQLLPDFLLIAFGALLARARMFDAGFWSAIERLVYFVLFPALLFRALATSPIAIGDAAPLVATGVAFTLAGMLLSALAQPLFRLPHSTFAACFQCGFRFNTYVALAAASRVGGKEGLAANRTPAGCSRADRQYRRRRHAGPRQRDAGGHGNRA